MTLNDTDTTATTAAPGSLDGGNIAPARFRPFSNPPTSERIEFTATAQDGEDVVRFNWRSMPGGAITEHVHPHQEERFNIIAGEAHFHPRRRGTGRRTG